jgi:multidrug efflux pump subunit AcrA (membrane-fusion protein)
VQGFFQAINYQDGASAKQGDTLFVIEPASYEARLRQAQASLAATQAQLTQSEVEFDRQSSLGKSDFSSRSAVDQARAARDSNQANLANLQAGVTQAAINLGYTRVTAPFDGQVTAHKVSTGGLAAFLAGLTGQMYAQFALVIAATAIISAINAATLKPTQCALWLRARFLPSSATFSIVGLIDSTTPSSVPMFDW